MAGTSASKRRPRADAERNRQRLLEAARAVFGRDGPEASLEEIARTAGVGIGTLYRHFPTREVLVEAVYRQAITQLGAAADKLLETLSPVEAIREWLRLFIDYMSTKRIMSEAFAAMGASTEHLHAGSGDIMRNTLERLVREAEAAGEIRPVDEPYNLLRAVGGIHYLAPDPNWEEGARAMVDILIAGLRKG